MTKHEILKKIDRIKQSEASYETKQVAIQQLEVKLPNQTTHAKAMRQITDSMPEYDNIGD